MSISKVNSTTKIIRRPDYARKETDPVAETGISNKDTKLDNKFFNDIILQKKEEKKKEHEENKKQNDKENNRQKKDSDSNITDFYV